MIDACEMSLPRGVIIHDLLCSSHIVCQPVTRCAVLSPLQLDVPAGIGARYYHTATVLSSGLEVLVLVHGWMRDDEIAISDPVVLHLGMLLTTETVL